MYYICIYRLYIIYIYKRLRWTKKQKRRPFFLPVVKCVTFHFLILPHSLVLTVSTSPVHLQFYAVTLILFPLSLAITVCLPCHFFPYCSHRAHSAHIICFQCLYVLVWSFYKPTIIRLVCWCIAYQTEVFH